jgi:hypothetical protein
MASGGLCWAWRPFLLALSVATLALHILHRKPAQAGIVTNKAV